MTRSTITRGARTALTATTDGVVFLMRAGVGLLAVVGILVGIAALAATLLVTAAVWGACATLAGLGAVAWHGGTSGSHAATRLIRDGLRELDRRLGLAPEYPE